MKRIIKNNILFSFILIVYTFLSISLIGYYDYSGDSSIYSVRAFGWTDYIGDGQKGVVEWLGHNTWWSSLSFQDAPPVVFGLQYIFFRIFGEDIYSVQILYILSGIILLLSIYYFVKKIRDLETALWSSSAFAVSSLALWSTLSGNLESIVALFIILSFLNISIYFKGENKLNFYLSVFFMAVSLMSKYTAVFILPSFIAGMYLFETRSKQDHTRFKKYLYGLLIFLFIISPTLIYNFHVYKFRGNFDTALSAMLGMNNELGRGISFNFVSNTFDVLLTLFKTNSFFYLVLCIVSFTYFIFKSQQKRTDLFEDLVVVYTSFYFIMLGFMGGAERWVPVFIPFFSIATGLFIKEIKERYNIKKFLAIILGILSFELFYSINTNYLSIPVGKEIIFSSSLRNTSTGFNELEKYLNKELEPLSTRNRVTKAEELKITLLNILEPNNKIIMYDGRINWFAKKWYLEKYFIYFNIGVFSYENSSIRNAVIPKNRIDNSILSGSGKTLYFVEAVSDKVRKADIDSRFDDKIYDFIRDLNKRNVLFIDVLNKNREVAFRVYKIQF